MGTEDINAVVGANVRRLRLAAGLSQEAFAHACGLHRTYIGSVERAERNITLATLARIAAALGTTPVELLIESHHGQRGCPGAPREAGYSGGEEMR